MFSRSTPAALAALLLAAGCASHAAAPSGMTYVPSPAFMQSAAQFDSTQTIGSGEIFGNDNSFHPNDGDSVKGGRGQTVDSIPCATKMFSVYHVHAFVGVLINGVHLALPDGTGMNNPGGDITFQGIPNWTEKASCYYYLHTHDASGVIHIESPQSAPVTASLYTLGNYFDVWGMTLSSTQIAGHTGTVQVYVANVPAGTVTVPPSAYSLYTGDPRAIPLYSHTSIWLEIGPTYVAPSSFPTLNYYEEY